MKLRRDDRVMVISGRDKGKTGKVLVVLPKENKVLVENINVVKRHTKPSNKQPRGGILEIAKPIDVAKLMAVDPHSGKPARIAYQITEAGKERVFKVAHHANTKPAKKADKPEVAKVEDKPKDKKDEVKK